MGTHPPAVELLAQTGQLLLEYNESTEEIYRTLETTARRLSDEHVDVAVDYRGIVLSIGSYGPIIRPVHELRYNASLQAQLHAILADVQSGKLDATAALELLEKAKADTPMHPTWLVAIALGIAAAGLAALLGADYGAITAAAAGTALGLVARRALGRHHVNILALPLTAAFIGAVVSGLTIQSGRTSTPGMAIIVPALMLIPGPHLINALMDLIDNHLPMSLARMWLATAIILVSALGIVLGIELVQLRPLAGEAVANSGHLNLVSDMLLAGIVTCGFAMFYNVAWRHIGFAVCGGMAGHGLRFLALQADLRLEIATFLGGMAVGVVSALIARACKVPFAVVAFAGAVTMMPGVQIYRGLAGALQLREQKSAANLATVSGALGDVVEASLVVSALTLGLVLAARIVLAWSRENRSQLV
jgi:uncharacterized membrane protein YjjP (DUF1212 family)